jgi:hypothetical protein
MMFTLSAGLVAGHWFILVIRVIEAIAHLTTEVTDLLDVWRQIGMPWPGSW